MNDERAMILNMLKEGKISVEEADALLDVVNGEPDEAPGVGGHTAPSAAAEQAEGAGRGEAGRRGTTDFRFDFDPSSLSEGIRAVLGSVKETMSGVSESLKHAFSEFGDLDIHFDVERELGRRRAEEQRRLSASADGFDRLHVSATWGDIRVSGADTDLVEVVADVAAWAATDEEAAARLRELAVELVPRDGVLVLELARGTRKTRTDCQIVVPRRFGVSVSSSSGDIWLEDVEGSQSVQTASGDISVASVGGDRSAHHLLSTKSGDIVAASLVGTIEASSASGDVRVSGFSGALSASSASGDISVSEGVGSAECKSVGGDVSLSMTSVSGRISATAVSGDVRTTVPGDASLDVTVSTLSGDIASTLALSDERGTRTSLNGRMNGGGIPLEISTVSGDVALGTP